MKIQFNNGECLNVTASVLNVGVPFPDADKNDFTYHIEFRFTISNPKSGRKMGGKWYGSYMDYLNNKQELDEDMARSILSSIMSDADRYQCARDFEDFCAEIGYCSDSMKAMKIYKACKSEFERLERVLDGLDESVIDEIRNF